VDIDVLLSWGTVKFGAVTVEHRERKDRASNYTFLKLVAHAIKMLLSFSTVPLRLATFIGFSFILFGAVVLVFVVGRFLSEGSVPGFPFLASITTLFSGAQLFAIGIIGEYLARVHIRQSGRPMSLVRGTTEGPR
jgi:undecaprenyl-phosphate 4-deoxy-4-formamido-L-arabinose transferase